MDVLKRLHVRAASVDQARLNLRRRKRFVNQESILLQQRFQLAIGKAGFHRLAARRREREHVLDAPLLGLKKPLIRVIENQRASLRAQR